MPKLTDSQVIIISAAAKREDGAALPLPKSLKLNKAAAARVLKNLLKRELLGEQPAATEAEIWREAEDGSPLMLVLSEAGREAIGVEPVDATMSKPAVKPSSGRKDRKRRDQTQAGAKRQRAPFQEPRAGTKQSLLVEMLRRKRGASIEEIIEVTGWQPHTVRGAISGAVKKKLGLAVTSEKVEDGGRVYRVVDAG